MRQQIRETCKRCPSRGSAGESPVETCVENDRFSGSIDRCPKIPDRVDTEERLGKVPNLARKPEFPYDVMRDGKCLAKLHSVYSRLGLLIENRICIVVKSVDVRAGKKEK
jgi:hypothetical protein